MENGEKIIISVELKGFENNNSLLAILSDYLVKNGSESTARITYEFSNIRNFPNNETFEKQSFYEFSIYGGDDPSKVFGYKERKWIPLRVLPALRNAESDLGNWRKSPLRPLIEHLEISQENLTKMVEDVEKISKKILELKEINTLSNDIEERLKCMVGNIHAVSPNLGIASTNALSLLKSLKIFVDHDQQRGIEETSLGICNIIYLTLLTLELEFKEKIGERAATFLAIEEPEAHLHPHLQRLIYADFFNRDSSVILTTHSPHISSISPLNSIMLLKDHGKNKGSVASNISESLFSKNEISDLERYLDVTKGEMLFAKSVVLVEGDAELYIVPACAKALGICLDQMGISICSVHGTDFRPYIKLLCKRGLDIPFVVITDGDPVTKEENSIFNGIKRGIKLVKEIDGKQDIKSSFATKENFAKGRKILASFGIFMNENTLELALLQVAKEKILETYNELAQGVKKRENFSKHVSDEKHEKIVKRIEGIGKGRYAQRLSSKIKQENQVPEYIKNALIYISNKALNLGQV